MKPTLSNAVSLINEQGALLVFPIKGKDSVPSLWKCLYPRSVMKWDWSEEGDDRVANLWHLRAALSDSRKVVYTKWYQNRATFFSFELFTAMLWLATSLSERSKELLPEGRDLLEVLEDDSPIATKQLRQLADLQGKANESAFNRGMRQLWNRLLVVGYGEIDEGGFPSLAVGSSRLLFEDLWDQSLDMPETEREEVISKTLPKDSPFLRQYYKIQKAIESR